MRHLLAVLFCVLPLGFARAQGELDRARDPHTDWREGDIAPVISPTPSGPNPSTPEFIEEERLDPSLLPSPDPEPTEPPPDPGDDGVELKLDGRLQATSGHDTNVFRAAHGVKKDGFFRGQGELELLLKLPVGTELFAEISGESLLHLHRTRANEGFVAAFVEIFQPLTPWLDVGVQNAYEYSRLNLLDDNGDLFPRGRFGSQDAEARAFFILRPQVGDEKVADGGFQVRDLAIEVGASLRDKDYEENRGVDSLDYTELRLDASISYRLSRRPRSRIKLKYRFRRRDYREFRARSRLGLSDPAVEPRLELHRHQVNLTLFQEVHAFGFRSRLIVGLGSVYNRDLHQNDRSYREGSVSVRGECWIIEDMTRFDASVRGVARNFIVRRAAFTGGHLHHRLVTVTIGFWQAIGRLPLTREPESGERRKARSDMHARLALFAEARATIWRSKDLLEDYDRYVAEGGLEISW